MDRNAYTEVEHDRALAAIERDTQAITARAHSRVESFRARHPGCMLFIRIGDFYEVFDADADTLGKVCGCAVTTDPAGYRLAGVPVHTAERYLRSLIAAGHRVAITELDP